MAISHKHQPFRYPEYISPLPADELIKVGMVKQNMYDQNVEKIQKHIDELDKYGFELVKDSDKKYFSQEMDKYMKAINESSGKTDFANMANVRNLLSISKPLETDPYVINAISSSKEYRKRYETLKSMKPAERSAANDWLYTKDAEEWLNDGKVGSTLSSGKVYIPYNDPSKYISDIVKNVKPDIKTKIVSTSDGRFLEKSEIEELTNQKLSEYMRDYLPSQIKQQVEIDAMYQVRNMKPEEKLNYYYDTRAAELTRLDSLIRQYDEYKGVLTTQDRQNLETLRLKKEVLTESLANFNETEQAADSAIVNDLYNKFITGQSNFYAYQQEKKELTTNQYALAEFTSQLRKNENYYKEITLGKEKQRLGLTKEGEEQEYIIGPGGQKLKLTESMKQKVGEATEKAEKAGIKFRSFTNNETESKKWEPLNVSNISGEDQVILQNVLKEAMLKTVNNPDVVPDKIDLDNVSIKRNPDNTYVFNVRGKKGVIEVFQDKFDDAFRKELELIDPAYGDYPQSVRSRYNQFNYETPNTGGIKPVNQLWDYSETPRSTQSIDSLYNELNRSFNP
ncbi:MAG: hypothetical protein RLZZ196_1173 [Bacteroidota bacterium]|jgi:hypothetical protein